MEIGRISSSPGLDNRGGRSLEEEGPPCRTTSACVYPALTEYCLIEITTATQDRDTRQQVCPILDSVPKPWLNSFTDTICFVWKGLPVLSESSSARMGRRFTNCTSLQGVNGT